MHKLRFLRRASKARREWYNGHLVVRNIPKNLHMVKLNAYKHAYNVSCVMSGGVETNSSMLDIRIDRCSSGETVCYVDPGYLVSVEADFIPGHATKSLKLGVDAVMGNGYRFAIMSAGIPNSSVQPGIVYVIKFSIVPNDVLAGETFAMEVDVLDDGNRVLFCVQTVVHINPFILSQLNPMYK